MRNEDMKAKLNNSLSPAQSPLSPNLLPIISYFPKKRKRG